MTTRSSVLLHHHHLCASPWFHIDMIPPCFPGFPSRDGTNNSYLQGHDFEWQFLTGMFIGNTEWEWICVGYDGVVRKPVAINQMNHDFPPNLVMIVQHDDALAEFRRIFAEFRQDFDRWTCLSSGMVGCFELLSNEFVRRDDPLLDVKTFSDGCLKKIIST